MRKIIIKVLWVFVFISVLCFGIFIFVWIIVEIWKGFGMYIGFLGCSFEL